ncbi:hypothetical protein BASA81_005360 [Batrachochytrium salamandrivorans]|nr:hypothetical protein BASA81_005360 [Batrachochytrium salamandrivorans]
MKNVLMATEGFQVKLEPGQSSKLSAEQIRLQVDRLALTVNVLGYAMSGLTLGYYKYFPVEQENSAEWGRVPTWGTCTVVESRHAAFPLGTRFYGLVPLSCEFVAQPKPIRGGGGGFVDVLEHRSAGNVVYNTYTDLKSDGMFIPELEDEMVLLRPLFLTAWLLREAIELLQADTVVITSASSKTGMVLACLLKQTGKGKRVIGITSPSNAPFVRRFDQVFDQVVEYSNSNQLAATIGNRVCVVDFAGNVPVLIALQHSLGASLVDMLCVGASHVQEADLMATLTGQGFAPNLPKPKFFFAPKYANAVVKSNPRAMTHTVPNDWHWFLQTHARTMLKSIQTAHGPEAIQQVLESFAKNKIPGEQSWMGTFQVNGKL